MAEFVDYTNVTELERFVFKLSQLNDSESNELSLHFRGVRFKLRLEMASQDRGALAGIPHFGWKDAVIARAFDVQKFWLLECSDEGRIVSEATARLLLSAVILSKWTERMDAKVPVFVGYGEDGECFGIDEGLSLFTLSHRELSMLPGEPILDAFQRKWKDMQVFGAFAMLVHSASGRQIEYPPTWGFTSGWCPVENVRLSLAWPRIERVEDVVGRGELCLGVQMSLDPMTAPIWEVSVEFADESEELNRVPLRGATIRRVLEDITNKSREPGRESFSILNRRLIESRNETACTLLPLMDAMERVLSREAERIGQTSFSLLPRSDSWIHDRIFSGVAQAWGCFVLDLEASWNELQMVKAEDLPAGVAQKVALLNWCIERELEWIEGVGAYCQGNGNTFAVDDVLPPKPTFSMWPKPIDERIEEVRLDIAAKSGQLAQELRGNAAGKDTKDYEAKDCGLGRWKKLELSEAELDVFGQLWIPFTLCCDLPSAALLPEDVDFQLAGSVLAEFQLQADVAAFKAANPGASFEAFLRWHSPKDVSIQAGMAELSTRMTDGTSLWCIAWKETEAAPLSRDTFPRHVTFSHRSLAGQLLSQMALTPTVSAVVAEFGPRILERQTRDLLGNAACTDGLLEEELIKAERRKAVAWAQTRLGLRLLNEYVVADDGERSDIIIRLSAWRLEREEFVFRAESPKLAYCHVGTKNWLGVVESLHV